jgi:hypothetical protein
LDLIQVKILQKQQNKSYKSITYLERYIESLF